MMPEIAKIRDDCEPQEDRILLAVAAVDERSPATSYLFAAGTNGYLIEIWRDATGGIH
jgi:hypothetical protein